MTSKQDLKEAQIAIQQAALAVRAGDRASGRRWASLAARLDPANEQPWLIMAAMASPQASVAYCKRALELNPSSEAAKKAMEWASARLAQEQAAQAAAAQAPAAPPVTAKAAPSHERTAPVAVKPAPAQAHARKAPRWAALVWIAVFLGLCAIVLSGAWIVSAGYNTPARAISALFTTPTATLAQAVDQETATRPAETPSGPRTTLTPLQPVPYTATPTLTPTVTPTPTETPSPTPTETPTEVPPTDTAVPPTEELVVVVPPIPPDVDSAQRWIDVDLTNQTLYAYEGSSLVQTFIVSTGTWQHPTVTGQYHIYVKYRYADMSGPGYYLADVPFVMYFYEGYGLHGTYWHNNFGTPMSHGCVNLRTDEAGWLFEWSDVGTLVNVHY